MSDISISSFVEIETCFYDDYGKSELVERCIVDEKISYAVKALLSFKTSKYKEYLKEKIGVIENMIGNKELNNDVLRDLNFLKSTISN